MRLLSVVLLLLAVSLASLTGCKARGTNGAAAKRSVSRGLLRRAPRDRSIAQIGSSLATRGTAECDCYTCRSKRQQSEEYGVDAGYEQSEFDPQTITVEQPISTTIEPPSYQIQPLISNPVPAVEEIQGELIQDFELTNELPDEPEVETTTELPSQIKIQPEPKLEVQPQLISPETGLNIQNESEIFEAPVVQETPVVQSTPLKAEQVSTKVNNAPVKALPFVNGSVFKIRTRDSSVLERHKVAPIRRKSIWFAPGVEPATEPTPTPSEPVRPQASQPVVPQEVYIPVIEHEIRKSEPINDTVVLKARPVDHHLIYNSRRPTHAPVREARLATDSRSVITHRQPRQQPRNTQLQFYPLPPQQPGQASPSPVAPTPVAPVAPTQMAPLPVVNPQSGSPLFSPVPPQTEEPAELRLKASVVGSGDTGAGSALAAPMARVIPSSNPMLRLNASPTVNQAPQMPAIVKIQDQTQGRVVVGSLQSPQEGTPQGTASTGMNRLHTSPWQPMTTGPNGSAEVQQSIRRLMIQPQQEANYSTDGIHR
ncbi:hypothetical protein N9L06_02940 [Mariniblastus sp.]|nr:hypothetical protein [Mariniblastus sp.]